MYNSIKNISIED